MTVDKRARTSLPRLWGAGEVTSSGLHGANRLASNSLLEGLVYGENAGRGASQAAFDLADDYRVIPLSCPAVEQPMEPLDLGDIRNSLKSLMWRSVGVQRDGAGLASALESIKTWCNYVQKRQFREVHGWELQNMLTVSRLVVEAALAREESRGVHFRSDFPEKRDENWCRHLTFQHINRP